MITFKKRYSTFTAPRWEYWLIILVMAGCSNALEVGTMYTTDANTLMLAALTQFAMVGIMLAVTAARCRDAGLNGWWALASFIPLVTVYFGCIRNDDHPKKLRAFEKLRANDKGALFK